MAYDLSIEVICTRILNLTLFLGFRGKNSFMLTPVTYIVINSISSVSELYSDSYLSFQPLLDVYSNASPDTVSSSQFSELSQCLDCKPMRFHCRVSWYLGSDIIYMQVNFFFHFKRFLFLMDEVHYFSVSDVNCDLPFDHCRLLQSIYWFWRR